MSKISMTIVGVFIAVGGSLLLNIGFSQSCSNEITTLLPTIIGGVISYIGRLRQGDITPLGFKKDIYQ